MNTCIAWHHKDKGTFDNGEPYCYDVIGIIGIYLDGVIPCQKEMKEIGSIGVDAGLAGFFHNKPDYTDDEWAAFCDRVSHGDAWLIKDGFYSTSGYGDGCYGVYGLQLSWSSIWNTTRVRIFSLNLRRTLKKSLIS